MDNLEQHIRTYTDKRRTICEVIREIWDLTYGIRNETIQEEMRARLLIIYEMAKKMNKKLHEYKFNWDEDFWEINRDYKKDLERRSQRKN